jgi:hypothetical protein
VKTEDHGILIEALMGDIRRLRRELNEARKSERWLRKNGHNLYGLQCWKCGLHLGWLKPTSPNPESK